MRFVREFLFAVYVHLPLFLQVLIFNIYQILKNGDIKKCQIVNGNCYIYSKDTFFCIAHPGRLYMYMNGLDKRISNLVAEYGIEDQLHNIKTLIDIGANVGEFGYAVKDRDINYIAFEPDKKNYKKLCENLKNLHAGTGFQYTTYEKALGDENKAVKFYSIVGTADSSVIESNTITSDETYIVQMTKLSEYTFPTVGRSLLKVEAEGFEPEILKGAGENIYNFDYIAVDGGPERNGESTIEECINILTPRFKLLSLNLKRGTGVFENCHITTR